MKIHITDGIAALAAMICKSANYAFYRSTKVRPALELLKQRLVHSSNIEDGELFKRIGNFPSEGRTWLISYSHVA